MHGEGLLRTEDPLIEAWWQPHHHLSASSYSKDNVKGEPRNDICIIYKEVYVDVIDTNLIEMLRELS